MYVCSCVILMMLSYVGPLLGCSTDQRNGVSTNIACSERRVQVTWNISLLYAYQTNAEGVKCIKSLLLNCTHNNTVVFTREVTNNWCVSRPHQPLTKTHMFLEPVDLPSDAVCQLTGCYKWISTEPFVQQMDYALSEKQCTITSKEETVSSMRVSPTETHSMAAPVSTASLYLLSLPPTSSLLGTINMDSTVEPTTTVEKFSSVIYTPILPPSENSSDGRLLILVFFVSLSLVLLILCLLFLIIMVAINRRTKKRLKLNNRKYFEGLKDFDNFQPVNPSMVSAVSVYSIPDPIDANVSLGYRVQTGDYTSVQAMEQCTHSLDSENTVRPYQFAMTAFSREPPVLCVERSTSSVSFDLLSMQSIDVPLSHGGTATIRDTNDYICNDYICNDSSIM